MQRWSPCLKNLLEDTIWSPSPWTLQVLKYVLGLRTALLYDMLKMGQGHEQCCFVSEHARELAIKNFWRLNFVEKLRICGRRPFFLRSPAFRKNFEQRPFILFLGEHFGIVSLVLGLEHSHPWPQIFWCPWPWALCSWLHLSTFDVKLVINLANLQTC